jgi:hypothetical protein
MFGLFVSKDDRISIIEGDVKRSPRLAADPAGGNGRYALISVDAIMVEDEPRALAVYEQVPSDEWSLAIRKVGSEEAQ